MLWSFCAILENYTHETLTVVANSSKMLIPGSIVIVGACLGFDFSSVVCGQLVSLCHAVTCGDVSA